MFRRLAIYIREMFPLGLYIPFAFINHYVLFFTVQAFMSSERLVISTYSLIGVATIIGFMFMMRVFDEFKDEVVDARLFPMRPYPRGAVLKKDLWILLWSVFGIIVLLNSYKSYTLPFFLACSIYGWLTYKWFFLKKYIQPYLFAALLTHQPISILLNLYIISSAMVQTGIFQWNTFNILCSIIFYLPVLAWEISRKIKAKGKENEYVTYSKLIGPKTSSTLVLLVIMIYIFSLIFFGYLLNFSIAFYGLMGALTITIIFLYFKFIFFPIEKNLVLKKTAEIGCTAASLIYLVYLVIEIGWIWKW